jgi:hypothetical protein
MRMRALAGIGPRDGSTEEEVTADGVTHTTWSGSFGSSTTFAFESTLTKMLTRAWIDQLFRAGGSRREADSPVNLFFDRALTRFLYTLESRVGWWGDRRSIGAAPQTNGDHLFATHLDSLAHLLEHRDTFLRREYPDRFSDGAAVLILGHRLPQLWPDREWTDDDLQLAHYATTELEILLTLDHCGADAFRPFADTPPPPMT